MSIDIIRQLPIQSNPKDAAAFACTSRLLSSFVTEALLRAFYFPLEGFDVTGFCVFLNHEASSDAKRQSFTSKDIFAIAALRNIPVLRHRPTNVQTKEIMLLAPLDMTPLIFDIFHDDSRSTDEAHTDIKRTILSQLAQEQWNISHGARLMTSRSTVALWKKYGRMVDLDSAAFQGVSMELASSEKWQQHAYQNPRPAPQFTDPSIVWEQSIIDGHFTHPMHKTRMFVPPIPDYEPEEYDLLRPMLRLVSFPRSELKITCDFERYTKPLLEAMSKKAGMEVEIPDGHVVVPVHAIQVAHIQDKLKSAIIYPDVFSLPLLAMQSLRSVVVPDVLHDVSLKLTLGIRLTSVIRTMRPAAVIFGPRFSKYTIPLLALDPNILIVAKDVASISHAHPDPDLALHCTAMVRECHENTSEERGERHIVCTALFEQGHAGEGGDIPAVIRVFELDSEDKRIQWLTKYVRILFSAFLPSVLTNGLALDCHLQNTVARFDLATKDLKGFIIRDNDSVSVHPETFKASTGVDFDYVEGSGHPNVFDSLDAVYIRFYHSLVRNSLQQVIRVLGLHYNGKGWRIVREQLEAVIPKDHSLYAAWLSPERKSFPGMCFLRMRMAVKHQYSMKVIERPYPNLILYEGEANNVEYY